MKKVFAVFIVIAAMLAITSLAYGEVVITHLSYTSHGQPYNDYITKMAAEFSKRHPGVRVDIIVGNQEKMKTMMVAGVWPDVLDMPDFDYLGREGALVDVRPLLQKDNLWKYFNGALMQQLIQSNGAVYKAPFEVSVVAGFFNRDSFNKLGLKTPDRMSPKEWTWDAMMSAGKKLTRDLNGDGKADEYGVDRVQNWWRAAVFQAGGTFYEFDKNDQPVRSLWNSPEVLTGVQYAESMFRAGITPFTIASNYKDLYFWFGKTAIDMTDGVGIINAYLQNAGFEWDFCLQPAGPAGPIANSAEIAGPMIMAKSKNVDLAWEWVKFFAMTKENLGEWVAATGRMPALLSALAEYPAAMKLGAKNFNAVLEQANYPAKQQFPVDTAINPRLISLTPVWNGSTPAANFLEAQHAKATAYIEELRAKSAQK